ncbi:MAG: sigma-54-dependent Fis family transcriptional regulator [Halieaceae bacterium]|nr:sigma-54-dependent Fis family transcriptional regulator [Halieaceae bacterium]
MPVLDDNELTLPSVVATLGERHADRRLALTLIFHPQTARIGERAWLPRLREGDSPWILGRRSPDFGRDGQTEPGPLEELHVSRQALALSAEGDGLLLRRLPASSRCRVAGRELEGEVYLTGEQLQRGVPLLMGHAVVLLLRYGQCGEAPSRPSRTHGMRGSSRYMSNLLEHIEQVAGSDMDVLIRGETGTGKELVATAIHRASRRADGPLVSVNMTAIPQGLAAASLFGAARGAFTGAHKATDGYFTQAEGGSLFLDEIGDTPQELQPQLLRALQQREIQLVGGPVRRADVRIISATDTDIDAEGCGFRAALKHRLGGCEIRLAPLREHPEDIGELMLHYLAACREEAGVALELPSPRCGGRRLAAWSELFYLFLCYHWPGNIRQLANFVGQIMVASGDALVVPESVGSALRRAFTHPRMAKSDQPAGSPGRRMQQVGEEEFAAALRDSAFEVARTARQLGVSRQAVYRRIEASTRHRLAEQVPLAELQHTLATNSGDLEAAALALRVSASGLRARLRAAGAASRV